MEGETDKLRQHSDATLLGFELAPYFDEEDKGIFVFATFSHRVISHTTCTFQLSHIFSLRFHLKKFRLIFLKTVTFFNHAFSVLLFLFILIPFPFFLQ